MRSLEGEFFCTGCAGKLAIQCDDQDAGQGRDAQLACPKCGRCFPVRGKLPRFVPANNYAQSFGFQWNRHARTQLDSHTGKPISRDRLFAVTGWSNSLQGERILEAGCGAGRFTEVLLTTGAAVYSFDYSSAVDANQTSNGHASNLVLFQADIFDIPLALESFDKVLCLGVLQHTPDPERAFKCLSKLVKPGGQLVIDIYRGGLVGRLQWKYLLRPITKRLNQARLYNFLASIVPYCITPTSKARAMFGRFGARLSPILEYSDLQLPGTIGREWAILDTFDMYSPAHDHPQTLQTVRNWFSETGFVDVVSERGVNGIVGRGRRPVSGRKL